MWMNLEVLSTILGNTGKPKFSSIKMCKKKKIMQEMAKFSSNIRFLLLKENEGESSFVKNKNNQIKKIMFLPVAFEENWVSLFAS